MPRASLVGLAFVLALTAIATATPSTFLPRQDVPQDDETTWKAAVQAFDNRKYADAARLFEKLASSEKYKVEASFRLATCDLARQNVKSGLERFEAFVKANPKHENAPDAQLGVAQCQQRLQKKSEAITAYKALFRDYPDTAATQRGLWQYWNLVEKQFQFSVHQSYTEGEEPVVRGYLSNIDSVTYRVFRVDTADVVKRAETADKLESIQDLIARMPATARTLVKEWVDEVNVSRREHKSIDLRPPVKDAGVYIVEAEHDDIRVHVSVVIARYGIIVKTAADRTVVFAVDRRTGRAQAGMKLRLFQDGKVVEGETDSQGLFVTDRGFRGAVVGIKDGELAMSNVNFNGVGEETRAYVFTDRPVYRPSQKVHWKIIARKFDQGAMTNMPAQKCQVTIRDARYNTLQQKDVVTNEFGSVSGELMLGDEPPIGMYYVHTSLGGYGQFRVEEYRKPEYEVIAAFEGTPYAVGDDLKARIDVKYYFGSPVVDSDLTYTIWRRPYYKAYWRCWDYGWGFDDDEEEFAGKGRGGRRWYGYGEQVGQGTGRTDKEGMFRVAFKPAAVEYDAVYTVVARVVDRSRREVVGESAVKVTRASVELSVATSRSLYKPGDRVLAKVRALDTDGKPVKDFGVTLSAEVSNYWHREGKHGVDYGDVWKGESRTDENGVASFEFTPEKEGYLRLLARGEDKGGREVKEQGWTWVSGRGWSASFQNFEGLDIVTDKPSYAAGETAQVLITSQHKNVDALFAVECDGLYRHEVVRIKGHSALVEVPIDGKRHAPNVWFSVTALVKNEYVSKSKSVSVPPAESLLNVKVVMDKKQYRPRESARVTVEVTDAAGKPAVAELSIGMVDESIYAIQEELVRDMRKFFFSKRWNRVATNSSIHFADYGRAELKHDTGAPVAKAGAAPAADQEGQDKSKESTRGRRQAGGDAAATEVRSYFPDTMYWQAHVVTGADGKFTYETPVPDSLTTWRTTVRGMTVDSRVGNVSHEVIARKEIIVRLTTPRFLTQNDTCTISAVVHNYRSDVDEVTVKLESEGVDVTGDREVVVKVPTGEDRRVDWKVSVKNAGKAKLTARALTPVESDAMQLVLPILPHGMVKYVARAGVVEGRASAKVTVPANAIAEATELRLSIAPSVASQVLEALDYLAGYPYGCVEQTMSRFLPTVVTATSLRKLGIERKELSKELPDMVAAGLQRLYNFQHGDGGWGWWEADASHPFMTAYVMYGIARAREADFFVDPGVVERGLSALDAMVKAGRTGDNRRGFKESPADARMYMVFVLAENGRVLKDELDGLFKERAELSNYSKALLALALQKAQRGEDGKTVLANLDETAKQGEAHCYWDGHQQRWHWMSNTIETTAYALKALVAADPKDAKIHKIVRWLAANRQGNRWNSTKDTAAVVFALSDYMSVSGELDPDFTLVVKLDGKELMRERITKANVLSFDGSRVLPAAAGDHEVTIEKEGRGALYYAAHLKYFLAEEDLKESTGSMTLQRSYAKVTYRGKDRDVEDLENGATVKSGDLIEVTLTVTADGPHEYMMIEDPLPSGFEVVKEDRFYGQGGGRRRWNYWYSRVEARDDRVCVASTSFNGTQTVTYTLRAETPGEFHVLPARAFNMYVPEIAGWSSESRIKVTEK